MAENVNSANVGQVYESTPEEKAEAADRMAEAAIRIERWRKKGNVRRNHDLVTVLLSLGILEHESAEHEARRIASDKMASLANEENQWHRQ